MVPPDRDHHAAIPAIPRCSGCRIAWVEELERIVALDVLDVSDGLEAGGWSPEDIVALQAEFVAWLSGRLTDAAGDAVIAWKWAR